MRKKYTILLLLAFSFSISKAQFTVTATASTPTICLGGSTQLTALASPISYTGTPITYDPLPALNINQLCSGGTAIVTPSFGTGTLLLDDSRWDGISLPFSFTYFGNTYSTVSVSTNGWMTLGTPSSNITTGFGASIPNTAVANNVIFSMLADLTFKTNAGGPGGNIEYYTEGFMPGTRKFVVMWNDCKFLSGGPVGSVQVILYETTNVIEIHTSVITNTTTAKTQGVENSGGTAGVASAGKNGTTNWGASATAYRFTPETITYSWSPAAGLSSTTGRIVTATPNVTTTYTVTATNSASQNATNTATVTINSNSFTLAGTPGGSSISHYIDVNPSGTYYRDMSNCNLIAYILPSGASPVSNSVNTVLNVDVAASKRNSPDLYLARKYDIEPLVAPATSTATLTLYFLQTEFNNFNTKAADSGHKPLPTGPADATGISNFILRQFHGTGTEPGNYSGSSVDFTTATPGFSLTWNATRNWWEAVVPVNGFSGFYVTSGKTIPVPVKLIYFTGTQSNNQHKLNWKVSCTSTEAKFEIERSNDGSRFTKTGGFTASQQRCYEAFDFIDEAPMPGINYYRIKVIDVDGSYYYTNIVALTSKTRGFEVVGLNPNIISSENAVLKINSGDKAAATAVISDFSGRIISKTQLNIAQGMNSITLQTNRLTAGTYQLTVYAAENKPQTIRFVKQ